MHGLTVSCVRLHNCSHFSYAMGKAGVRRSRLKGFFPSIRLKVGINLNKNQGCKTDHRSQRDMRPQAISVLGKVEESRTFNAIMGTTKIVQTLALPSESTELIKD